MIPKIIHYCWLSGDKYPKEVEDCLSSWSKFLPSYELMLWDLNRFQIDKNIWVRQAFESKKYAFAADYIRLYAVYHFGGIYFDTDVEVVKSFDELLHLPYFIGSEGYGMLEAGVFGAEKNMNWVKDCLDYYDNKLFVNEDGSFNMQTLPSIMGSQILKNRAFKNLISLEFNDELNYKNNDILYVFPREFFSAKEMGTGKLCKTERTYSIHHFAMSWIPRKDKFLSDFKRKMMFFFGVDTINYFIKFLRLKELKDWVKKK